MMKVISFLFYVIMFFKVNNMDIKNEFIDKYKTLFKDKWPLFYDGFFLPRIRGLRLKKES